MVDAWLLLLVYRSAGCRHRQVAGDHAHGCTNLVDVIVFNDLIIERALFHGLVHAAQFQILGLDRYTDLLVRAFLRTRAHFTVPLETHAFALESKFALNPTQPFSVEEQVRQWLREGRYS